LADIKVREKITLISPKGTRFEPLWAGGTRSVKKRLARYSYAGINGEVVDDYGCDSVTYPISLIFEGEGNRKKAKEFFDAFQESGKWRVTHPTEGELGLQGVECVENDQPVREANIVRIDTQWVEYIDPVTLKTLHNALVELGLTTQILEQDVRDRAVREMILDPAGQMETKAAAESMVKSLQKKFANADALHRDFISSLNEKVTSAAAFISKVQNTVKASGQAINDLKARLKTYRDVISDLFDIGNDPIEFNRNDALVKEACATACIVSAAEGIISSFEGGGTGATGATSGLRSRGDLLTAMSDFDDLVDTVMTACDRLATESTNAGAKIEEQYIPFADVNMPLNIVISQCRNAMREQFFILPVEKRFITRVHMSPLTIAYKYWGTTGINDDILQMIEDGNGLTRDNVLLIPPGTQVRIYA
jgi:prophage DNA circulation protein